MTQRRFIKTDGPIPMDCDYITAGKVYPVLSLCGPLAEIHTDSRGIQFVLLQDGTIVSGCAHIRPATWYFCDSAGNPVPAPWEDEPMETAEEMAATHPEPVNWQAHAEALTEALRMWIVPAKKEKSAFELIAYMEQCTEKSLAALAAFDQDRG